MTNHTQKLAAHYAQPELITTIKNGIEAIGKTTDTVTIADLAPMDEFHIGGRAATKGLIDQIGLSSDDLVLDIGCGLGGTARFVAKTYGCQVQGVDLTSEYIQAGNEICKWLGMSDRVHLMCKNALETGFNDAHFCNATMLHVGMNIPDKHGLFMEVSRVLKTGGQIGIYDILRQNDEDLNYPVPWSATAETCAAASLETYCDALDKAGFDIVSTRDRGDIADAFFEMLQKNAAAAAGPPPLGLHLLMGKSTPDKVKNMVQNIKAGRISPTEIIARKR